MFSVCVSDYVTPDEASDFGVRPFAFPKDSGPESLFSESESFGQAVNLSDHSAGINPLRGSLHSTKQ